MPDLFHAVDGGGNCLPGPCRPFGLVRPGPDMINHNTSGYATGEDIRHFSHLHVSGTGGEGRYGNLGIVPIGQYPDPRSLAFTASDEEASPGYYGVTLRMRQKFGEMANQGTIRCGLTATSRAVVHRYVWEESLEPWIRIDAGWCIAGFSQGGWVEWQGAQKLVGRADYRGGWGHDEVYTIYFALEFSVPMTDREVESARHRRHSGDRGEGSELRLKARVSRGHELEIKVGVSFVSVDQAGEILREEIGADDFAAVQRQSREIWEALLGRLVPEGGEPEEETLAKTFWLRLHTMPGMAAGENFPWSGKEDAWQVNDLYCLWDSVRCANSLFALTDPSWAVRLNDALVGIGRQSGWVPDAWIMGASAQIQGGCSAAVLFAEAVLKQLPGFDAVEAWKVLQRTLEEPTDNPMLRGRFADYAGIGYLPEGVPNCASRTIEYAGHDLCAAVLAEAAGDEKAAWDLRQRAERLWENWDEENGCFAPRDRDGQRVAYNPWKPQVRDFWNDPHYYEGTAHDYTLGAWFTIAEQVRRRGGAEAFSRHLETFLQDCYFWKEINLHVPWLFHFAGDPDRSGRALRELTDRLVRPGRAGLPDNEDMGAWSSWWLTAAMGLGPVPGTPFYLLAAPRFPSLQIHPVGGDPLIIRREGGDPMSSYLTSIRLNGQDLDRAWVRHDEIAAGGELVLTLGAATRRDWRLPFAGEKVTGWD